MPRSAQECAGSPQILNMAEPADFYLATSGDKAWPLTLLPAIKLALPGEIWWAQLGSNQ